MTLQKVYTLINLQLKTTKWYNKAQQRNVTMKQQIKYFLERIDKKDKDILYRLLQYSLFEESETDLNEMTSEGLFEYKYFDKYFTDNDRWAYFIKEKQTNKLLGFVMINCVLEFSYNGHSIAEYLIIPKYRRLGLGKRVAFEILDRFKGNWEIKPSFQSEKAYLFWKKVVEEYTQNNYEYKKNIFVFAN